MKENPHIVFIHKEFPCSGAEKVTCATANFLCANGYRVTILAAKHNEDFYPKNFKRRFEVVLLPNDRIKTSKAVACCVRDFIIGNDVRILVTYRELLYAKWIKAKTDVKVVFHLHNSPFYEFLDIEEKKSRKHWVKLIYYCGLQWLLTQFYESKYRRVYSWADAYGVLCKDYRQVIIDNLKLPTDNKVWVLPNFIETATAINWEKQKEIVYVGRLNRRDKRVDRLLHIWKKAQPKMLGWSLKIVGEGRDRANLQALSTYLQLENISFEGQTNNVKRYYDEASILCLTSTFEGWPMVVAEAQSNGVIPIVYDSFLGAKEMISTEEEGILIAPFDEEAYAVALVRLTSEPQRLERMRRFVVQKANNYSIQRTSEAWIKMLCYLLK